jgi:hypothetical protein
MKEPVDQRVVVVAHEVASINGPFEPLKHKYKTANEEDVEQTNDFQSIKMRAQGHGLGCSVTA